MVLGSSGIRQKRHNDAGVNIKLTIEYDGRKYFGWQKQAGKPTIQATIEDSLRILFPEENIKLTGAGRTDTGVHALGQVANFRIGRTAIDGLGLRKLLHSVNSILPEDITIKDASIAGNGFHPRYSARKRIYRYYLSTRKRSFSFEKVHIIKTKFDIDLAKDFCKLLKGDHSFRNMCKARNDTREFRSVVHDIKVSSREGGLVVFEICANRFLHSMVRAIVGMMLAVASGKVSLREFSEKFSKEEQLKIQYAPPHALVLVKIIY